MRFAVPGRFASGTTWDSILATTAGRNGAADGSTPATRTSPTMSPNRRNVFVGLTVLGAALILAGMLLKFGGPSIKLFRSGLTVQVHLTGDRADGLSEGAQVTYLGQSVGRVLRVARDQNNVNVNIDAEVDDTPPLPGNVEGIIRINSPIGGSAVLSLELVGGATAKPEGMLADGQHMVARYVGSELVPPSIMQLADQLRDAHFVMNLNDRVRETGDVLRGLRDYVDDPKTKANVQASLENFRHVSEVASRAADNVDRFSGNLDAVQTDVRSTITTTRDEIERVSKQLDDRMLQVSRLLDSAQSLAAKVDKGQGTAALLINDPKLYQSLVDNSRELNVTIATLKRLADQWEQEGVALKLK
jgi:ABC-type transporter Mla subunit MlaD